MQHPYQPPPPQPSLLEIIAKGILAGLVIGGAIATVATVASAAGEALAGSDDDESEGGDTWNYRLQQRGKTVYHGITNRPLDRPIEHIRDGKKFDTVVIDDEPKARSIARMTEVFRLMEHREENGGRNPKYNKKRDG